MVAGRPLVAALAGILLAAAPAAAGTLVAHAFASATLGREWKCAVYEPDIVGAERLPVLYLLHGYGGNENDWVNAGDLVRTADSLITTGAIPPCLIVMPDGGNSWWVNGPERIETAFFTELIPHVESTWRVIPRREGRLIGGLSMGGYGALRFALGHPGVFAAAAVLSPAIYDPVPPLTSGARHAGVFGAGTFDEAAWKAHNWPALWEGYRAARTPVPLWIVAGDDDPFHLEREAMALYVRCRADSLPAELRIADGGHDWALWSRGLAGALPWMFRMAGAGPAETPPRR